MNIEEARELLKSAVDPLTLAGFAASAGAGAYVGKKIGAALQRRAMKKHVMKLLTKDASDRRAKIRSQRAQLHKLVQPMAHKIPYKTKTAKGWDVAVDALLGDSQTTGAGH